MDKESSMFLYTLNRKKLSGPVAVRRGDRLQIGHTVLEVAK